MNLQLRDAFLGFAAYRDPDHPVHQAIAGSMPDDRLQARMDTDRCDFRTTTG